MLIANNLSEFTSDSAKLAMKNGLGRKYAADAFFAANQEQMGKSKQNKTFYPDHPQKKKLEKTSKSQVE